MSLPNQNSLQITIQQLKEIVFEIQGEDHETYRLVRQMEVLVSEIERKANTVETSNLAIMPAGTPLPV